MVEVETDLHGNHLVRKEELNIIYDGPSFKGKMEISDLASQLKSTELVIREIVSELYKQKGLKNPEEVKIYLSLKRGSFQEIISVLFNNPTTAHIIGGCVVALFTYFLTKKKFKDDSCKINLENLTNNYILARNVNQIIQPLQEEKDKVMIISSDPEIKASISTEKKKLMKKFLKELKKQLTMRVYQGEFFGYLSVVDIDKERYGFTLEETDRHIPIVFDIKPSLKEIKKILGFRLKINARAFYEEGELKKLEIENYEIKRLKNLNDFGVKK